MRLVRSGAAADKACKFLRKWHDQFGGVGVRHVLWILIRDRGVYDSRAFRVCAEPLDGRQVPRLSVSGDFLRNCVDLGLGRGQPECARAVGGTVPEQAIYRNFRVRRNVLYQHDRRGSPTQITQLHTKTPEGRLSGSAPV